MTLEERCYVALQHFGGTASVAQVRTRVDDGLVGHAMTRLRLKGLTRRVSFGVYAIIGKTNLSDGRGQSRASQANIGKAKLPKRDGPPKPRLELEKAWGWMPPFSVDKGRE